MKENVSGIFSEHSVFSVPCNALHWTDN